MFLNLIVAELEHLELIREGSLGRLGLCEEVDHLAIREGLLDVLIVEVDNGVAIGERFPLDSVIEDDLLLSVLVDSLDFAIMTDKLLDNFLVRQSLAMVLFGELKTEIFFLI